VILSPLPSPDLYAESQLRALASIIVDRRIAELNKGLSRRRMKAVIVRRRRATRSIKGCPMHYVRVLGRIEAARGE
jgi:hypothetical protein